MPIPRRVKPRLTYANVMATFAVFIALGGTALAASYLVSSNSQVGPGVIAGHAPPTGKHSNIIPGSINGTDVHLGTRMISVVGGHAAYGRDAFGFVHLDGVLQQTGGTTFTLPPGYRPKSPQRFPCTQSNCVAGVGTDGVVEPLSGYDFAELYGDVFRCWPSGKNGCP
jgi:hypothetical protein